MTGPATARVENMELPVLEPGFHRWQCPGIDSTKNYDEFVVTYKTWRTSQMLPTTVLVYLPTTCMETISLARKSAIPHGHILTNA